MPWGAESALDRPTIGKWLPREGFETSRDLLFSEPVDYWPRTLLDWRWVDKSMGTWMALAQYWREGLTYLHWVSGEHLDVEPQE